MICLESQGSDYPLFRRLESLGGSGPSSYLIHRSAWKNSANFALTKF